MKELDPRQIERVAEEASDAFWQAVAAAYPEVKTGDFDPLDTHALLTAMETAIRTWLILNRPDADE